MSHRISFTLAAIAGYFATPVLAHPGHVIETAGHTHWGALIAVGAAVAIGVWAAKKGKKSENVETEETEVDEEELREA